MFHSSRNFACLRLVLFTCLAWSSLFAFQPEVYRKLNEARSLNSDKKFDAALAKFNEVLAVDAGNLDALTGKMETLGYLKKDSDIETLTKSKLGQSASDLVIQGYSKYAAMSFDDAEKTFEAALAKDPKVYMAHYFIANIRFTKRDYPAAVTHLNKALATAPSFAGGYFLLGELHYRQKNGKEAIAAWKKYLEFTPKGTSLYNYVAGNLKRLGAN